MYRDIDFRLAGDPYGSIILAIYSLILVLTAGAIGFLSRGVLRREKKLDFSGNAFDFDLEGKL